MNTIFLPLLVKKLLGAVSSSINIISAFLVVRFFPILLVVIGEDGTFFLFTACTLLGIIFVYFLLPETKGKSLEEVEKLFTTQSNNKEAAATPPTIQSLL